MGSVLIVDDDKIMRDMLAAQLEHEEFSVTSVGSSDEALSILATKKIAVVVTDFQMPGRNGIEFLEFVKRERLDVPVILMTAFASSGIERRARESGACAFLAKPFSVDELLAAIRQVVSP